jgi:5-dehydro-2-deoxygluconokinase
MSLGYDGRLFILAFDHRGSFQKKMFGISGREPTTEEAEQLKDAKRLIWEGVKKALETGVPGHVVGALVDEEMGADVAREAKELGVRLAMPVEKSGQSLFDFEYGEAFGDHIEAFDPDFSKVLVRWNPDDPDEEKQVQGTRLKRLGDWLHARDRKYLFELLVPATDEQLALVGGDGDAYDTEARPYLTLKAIREILDAEVEPDIWKIEGLDRRRDCELLSQLVRSDGRDGVVAVVLGRGANTARVDHWLEMGAPVPGYAGFAIGRSIWWSGVEGYKNGTVDRAAAATAIAKNYRHFYDVYQRAVP